ncbi:MAG: carbohydrate binding family 9 domain-containing protein [Cyclobacteriaceae bacterium]|nr:carbohydrate binding family 9 domain-containing protein [Cyclobacteriaceae bacterium]
MPGLSISKIDEDIVIDGNLDECIWNDAEVADNFMQFFPSDTSYAQLKTEIRMAYDDNNIYIAAKMYNNSPGKGKYVTPSLRRDFKGDANDGISILFDTFKDRTNAFIFGVNPFGVQREGLISNGGSGGGSFSLNWDNKWYAEAKQYDGYWTAELSIPFKTLRFKEGLSSWYINFFRIDSQTGERSTWSPIPQNFSITSNAFNRELIWDTPLKKPGANISIIPHITTAQERDFEKGTPKKSNMDYGGDAKIALSSALNLDITINPDFSQVDVDQQVTNLDRFEIFFPERRQFFLENADLFSDFGVDRMRPFFSRRIGVAEDTLAEENVQNKILYGVRLSGKVNNNLRVGFLNMQGEQDRRIGQLSTNYTVATFQQKVFSRSNIGMILVNKQAFKDSLDGSFTLSPIEYNRIIGLDYNLASINNRWNGKFFYHRSFDPVQLDSTFATGADIQYNTLKWDVSTTLQNIGANYNPEVGFARRVDYQRVASSSWYNFYPASGAIQRHGPGFDFDLYKNQTFGITDFDINAMYQVRFTNMTNLNVRFRREYVYLIDSFDPTRTESLELAAGTSYGYNMLMGWFNSNERKRFSYGFDTRFGGYFNGNRINLGGDIKYRYQPYGILSMNFSYNRIRLPQPYGNADIFLVGPKFDFTFTKNIFWTTFVQYNSQIENLNINSRLQWRFKPVSDLFIVYTDNYFASAIEHGEVFQIGQPKYRSLVLKLTYWLNL